MYQVVSDICLFLPLCCGSAVRFCFSFPLLLLTAFPLRFDCFFRLSLSSAEPVRNSLHVRLFCSLFSRVVVVNCLFSHFAWNAYLLFGGVVLSNFLVSWLLPLLLSYCCHIGPFFILHFCFELAYSQPPAISVLCVVHECLSCDVTSFVHQQVLWLSVVVNVVNGLVYQSSGGRLLEDVSQSSQSDVSPCFGLGILVYFLGISP